MLFIDTSDLEALARFKECGICRGVTTNPLTLLKALAPGETIDSRVLAITAAHPGTIHVQIPTSQSVASMVEAVYKLRALGTRIVAKVPFTEIGLRAIHELRSPARSQILPLGATGIMTFEQACLATQAGAGTISISWNHIRDAGGDPHFVVRRTREVFDRQRLALPHIIVESVRTPNDVSEALKAGAHIVAVPPVVLEDMLWHPQTDAVEEELKRAWDVLDRKSTP